MDEKEKQAKDAAAAEEKVKGEERDAKLARIADSLDKLVTRMETRDAKEEEEAKRKSEDAKAKDVKDKKDDEEEEEKEEESEDADLIPAKTMTGNEVPENPIPGADSALDALRIIRPLVAKRGTKDEMAAYNTVVDRLKGRTSEDDKSNDGYARLATDRKKPDAVTTVVDNDPAKDADEFVKQAKQFHRRNVAEVRISEGKGA